MARSRHRGFKPWEAVLSLPTSTHVERCYATHGKGYGGSPPYGAKIDLLVINDLRDTRWLHGVYDPYKHFVCPQLEGDGEWLLLGWKMRDGTMPLGEHDSVDPTMCPIERLTWPHTGESYGHSICAKHGLEGTPQPKRRPHPRGKD